MRYRLKKTQFLLFADSRKVVLTWCKTKNVVVPPEPKRQ
jgi:hypothetical protein